MVDTSIQLWNDVYYVLSQDGLNWDFINGRVNITNYGTDNDSLWAFTDLALILDYNDNFHIGWNANWSSAPDIVRSKTFLFHYNSGTQIIDQIRTPWPDYEWPDSGCTIGPWNRPICKMDFGVRQVDDHLFAIWTQFDTSDCSAGGCANGDIWTANTSNGGQSWTSPENLTISHTPGCTSGNCDNDSWGSLADIVNYKMHLFYVNSKSECNHGDTESWRLYYDVPADIQESSAEPTKFALYPNYPNPFNTKTILAFEIKERCTVELDIYNVLGEKVDNLSRGVHSPGVYKAVWDSRQLPSGIYYAVLTSGNFRQTQKLTLVK